MTPDDDSGYAAERSEPLFATTHWSVVLTAGQDTNRAADALARLCQDYWYPLYAYARRRGCSPHDAQDLTQEFFARLLAGNWLARADPQRGRFRSFLLSAMKHFMANEWNKARTQKRGGGKLIQSLNEDLAEKQYRLEPADNATPEYVFDQRWAVALLERALAQLEKEYGNAENPALMEALRPALAMDREALNYSGRALNLNMSEAAVRMAVHRLRKRFRQLIRAEVANTVASPDEIDAEMRHLFQVLANG